jgi:hypothetical protein
MGDSYRRRAVLATAGAMLLAGCSAGDSDDEATTAAADTATDSTPTATPGEAAGTTADGIADGRTGTLGGSVTDGVMADTVDIPSNAYHYWEVTVDDPYSVNVEVEVREGANVDFLILHPSEFEAYAAGEEFDTRAGSLYDTDGEERWGAVPEGDWVLVVDNTPESFATPEGRATRVYVRINLEYNL